MLFILYNYNGDSMNIDIMKNNQHIIRKVPKSFHDLSVSTLPDSIDIIYEKGYKENLIDYMALITRDNKIIWEDKNKILPGKIYNSFLNDINYINNKDNNIILAHKTNEREMQGLRSNIEELKQLKQEMVYINLILDINTKIK